MNIPWCGLGKARVRIRMPLCKACNFLFLFYNVITYAL